MKPLFSNKFNIWIDVGGGLLVVKFVTQDFYTHKEELCFFAVEWSKWNLRKGSGDLLFTSNISLFLHRVRLNFAINLSF